MSAKRKDISSSSSEAEVDLEGEADVQIRKTGNASAHRRQRRTHVPKTSEKYQCPADFVPCAYRACEGTSLERLTDGGSELWLIKAPASFNPDSFNGSKIPVVGMKTRTSRNGSGQQVYNILSTPGGPGGMRLLTTGRETDRVLCAPAFEGYINICESFGDLNSSQEPKAIPANPAPRIPEGLKQRFQPFGGAAPSRADREPCASPPLARRIKLEPPEAEEGDRRRKKKKKRDKHQEREETEQEHRQAEGLEQDESEGAERRKKKKKKGKEREEVDIKEEPVEVKTEPLHLGYADEEDVGKKKKKKKKREKLKMEDLS
ncbi:DNA-directed RNA polymerase I subunit RPA34 [Lepisosteus oculatus]|uniref:DNA-directed RNA polymerase I subunit RPA34 n=1 Tax=Lepisosteus oculatus TaxID=7918 RepID=UPI00371141CF